MAELIMKRTDILCIDCMKKNLIWETKDTMYCDHCGNHFVVVDFHEDGTPKTYRYAE